MYRPEGCENPFKETIESVNRKYPNGIAKGYHVLLEAGRNEGYEIGADAMYSALWKMAEESPAKTFIIDANAINVPSVFNPED